MAPKRRQRSSRVVFNVRHGRFILASRLAWGGMGEVLLALDPNAAGLEQFVALKCLHRHMQDDARLVDMFYREAGIGKMLRHRNLVRVDDARMMAGRHTMVMDFAPGITVRGVLDRLEASGEQVPLHHALCMIRQAARGLGYAHRLVGADGKPMGLVHRDVSPDNIQIGFDGVVRVIDFGVAAAAMREQEGGLAGKIAYMSPEQARGEALDRRSDIFSLGTVFWELLRGECPYPRDNRAVALHQVANDEIAAPLESEAHDLASDINDVWRQMHALERRERSADARSLSEELRTIEINLKGDEGENLAKWMQSLFRTEFEELRTICEKVLHAPRPNASTVDLNAQFTPESAADSERRTAAEARQDEGGSLDVGNAPQPAGRAQDGSTLMLPTGEITTIDQVAIWRKQRRMLFALSLALLLLIIGGGTSWLLMNDTEEEVAAPVALRIDSEPRDATVYLDGEPLENTTPTLIATERGVEHRVELRLPGYEVVQDSFVVDAPRIADGLHYELQIDRDAPNAPIGEVRVSYSPSDAVLWIDGSVVSDASPAIATGLELNAPHVMRLEREGYETLFMDVVLTNDEPLEFDLQMNEGVQLARLTITSSPPGAEVEINEQKVGETPLVNFELPANVTYTVSVSEGGYRTWRRGVLLNNGDEAVHAALSRIRPREERGRDNTANNNGNAPGPPRVSNVNDAPNVDRANNSDELPYRLLE